MEIPIPNINDQSIGSVNKIGFITIKYDQQDYRIRIDNNQNKTMREIMDLIFEQFQLNKQLKKVFSLASHTSIDKNTLFHIGGSMRYGELTQIEKKSLKLIVAPMKRDINKALNT